MSVRHTALVALVAMAWPALAHGFSPIGVTVYERTGVDRPHWPVTMSVPFAPGELRSPGAVKVLDEHNAATPTQMRPLVQWPDGSVRWLLVDTQIDLHAERPRHLRVALGQPPAARHPLHVNDDADAVRVDTGAVRFAIPKRRFAIVDAVQPSGARQPMIGAMTSSLTVDQELSAAAAPERVTVMESGPLRARIELTGTYGNGFDYVVRVEAYAGQPLLRVWHTFIDRARKPYVAVPRLAVELPLLDRRTRYRYGVSGAAPVAGPLPANGLRLVQSDNVTFAVDGTTSTGSLDGWVELPDDSRAVGIASRWFWQEYPQSVTVQADRLVYNLWAPEAAPAKAGMGSAKTHELVIWAGPNELDPRGVAAPAVAVVDPSKVAHSGALALAVDPHGGAKAFVHKALLAAQSYAQRNAVEEWDDCGAVQCEEATSRRRVGAYGMWNWGDWNFRGYHDTTKGTDSWGNLEYDTAYVLALTYAASGDAATQEQMVVAARHFTDVDTIYAAPRPEWVGMNHPKSPLHFSFELGGPDLGHTWTQGSLAYYFLTGDERGLSAARGVADYLAGRAHGVLRGNPRQWGWPIIALLAVYDATADRRYLEAARVYARGGMRAHPPSGTDQWKLGILGDALAYFHAATQDRDARTWLEQYAAEVMKQPSEHDVRAVPAVAYVATLTGDRAMRAVARQRVDALDLGLWGKPFSVNGRIGFRIESLLAKTGEGRPARRR